MMVLDNRQDILSWYQSRGYVLTQETVCMWCVRARVRMWARVCYMRSWSACILACMFTCNVCLCVRGESLFPCCCCVLSVVCVCHMTANASSKSRACTKKKKTSTHRQRSPRASTSVCLNESYNSFGLRGRWNEDKAYRLKLFSSCCTAVLLWHAISV